MFTATDQKTRETHTFHDIAKLAIQLGGKTATWRLDQPYGERPDPSAKTRRVVIIRPGRAGYGADTVVTLDVPAEAIPRPDRTFLDDGESFVTGDEMSMASVEGDLVEVTDADGRLLGEVAQVEWAGHGTAWMARDAWHAEWGDIPGQHAGWHGSFPTEDAAAVALREAVAKRQRARA